MKKYVKFSGILILFVILLQIDLPKLIENISQIHSVYLLIALMLNIPSIFIKSYRWNGLLSSQNIQYSHYHSFLVYSSSIYVGLITPGRLGEFVKAFYLKLDKNISASKGMSNVILDRLFDMYFLIILGTVGLWQFSIFGKVSNIFILLLVVVVLMPLLMINKEVMNKTINMLYTFSIAKKNKIVIEEKFEDFYDGINRLINYKLLYAAFLTFLSYLIIFIQCYLVVIALNIPLDFITTALFMSISSLVSLIPISISGLGTRDAILIYMFSLIGLEPELAVSYAFMVFFTFFICSGLIGAVAWWIKPLRFSQ